MKVEEVLKKSRPFKVAIIPHPQNAFPPQSGSVAKVVWENVRRLAATCEVTIFCRRKPVFWFRWKM
jgi:hypothetical protein